QAAALPHGSGYGSGGLLGDGPVHDRAGVLQGRQAVEDAVQLEARRIVHRLGPVIFAEALDRTAADPLHNRLAALVEAGDVGRGLGQENRMVVGDELGERGSAGDVQVDAVVDDVKQHGRHGANRRHETVIAVVGERIPGSGRAAGLVDDLRVIDHVAPADARQDAVLQPAANAGLQGRIDGQQLIDDLGGVVAPQRRDDAVQVGLVGRWDLEIDRDRTAAESVNQGIARLRVGVGAAAHGGYLELAQVRDLL